MLIDIAPSIWQYQSSVRLLPGAHLPLRMTVVRLHDGSLLLHSPTQLDDALAEKLERLGRVGHLVAPNLLHHQHLESAQQRYPEAKLYAPAGLPAKNAGVRLDVPSSRAAEHWAPEVECFPLHGAPQLDEWVFHHVPSRSLIVTDLVFHVHEPQGWLTPWVLRAAGTHRRLAVSRILERLVVDRAAFLKSLKPILELHCERVLIAHSDSLEAVSMSALRRAIEERFGV